MCGKLVNLDTVARVLAEYYHLKTETQLAALDEALSRVPAETVGGGHGKDHIGDSNKMVGDSISRQAAIEAIKEDKIDLTDPNVVAVFKTTGDFEKVETQVMTCDRHIKILKDLPSANPEIVACGDCIHWICHDRRCGYWNHGVKPLDWCCHAEMRDEFEDVERVDAVPVVHGHWKEDPSGYGFWICSACGFVSEASAADMLYKFCPVCGARMDGKDGEGRE